VCVCVRAHLEHEITASLVHLAILSVDTHETLLHSVAHRLELTARRQSRNLGVAAV